MTPTTSDPRSARFLGGLALDLRASIRGLRRRPAFTLTAIGTIALGVGASTAMFSAVDSILLRDLRSRRRSDWSRSCPGGSWPSATSTRSVPA